MAASQVAVETGGKSRLRFSISAPAWASGMGALLDDLKQIAEGGGFGGLGVKEEDCSAPRAFARRLVDNLEAVIFQVIERLPDVGYAQRDVRHAAAAAVLLNLPGHRRFGRQRLQLSANQWLNVTETTGARQFKPSDIGFPAYMDQHCEALDGCAVPLVSWNGYTSAYGGNSLVMGRSFSANARQRSTALKGTVSHIWRGH